ncbi:hypothetical protein SDC9_204567 [bioreactor metagenome]|uniref:Uncharacterized protein n=1 Tax=bioreactor metagenome TaxID=1076179 RepID=A0A645J8S0_9ZZZZ
MRNAGFIGEYTREYGAYRKTGNAEQNNKNNIRHLNATPPCFFFRFLVTSGMIEGENSPVTFSGWKISNFSQTKRRFHFLCILPVQHSVCRQNAHS